MSKNTEMPRKRRGGRPRHLPTPINGAPSSASNGASRAAGRASRISKPNEVSPGRTNTNATRKGGSERATPSSIPTCGTPARTLPMPAQAGGDRGQSAAETHAECASVSTHPAREGGRRRGQVAHETHIPGAAAASNQNEDETMRKAQPSTTPSKSSRRRGQTSPAARTRSAAAAPHPGESRGDAAGHDVLEIPATHAGSIAIIRSLWRRRQAWHRAEKSLSLAIHAVCRQHVGSKDRDMKLSVLKARALELRGRVEAGATLPDEMEVAISVAPLLAARAVLEPHRNAIEKELAKLVKPMPIAPWALAVPGIGTGLLSGIIGEAGDVGSYRSVSAFWKRMGLAVINGERQRRKAGVEGIEHGFSPERGAVSFNVGAALIGGKGNGPRLPVGASTEGLSPYQALFVERCRYLAARDPDEFARAPVEKNGVLRESFSKHCAYSARRYVTKRFFRHLFAEWRRLDGHPMRETQAAVAVEPTFQEAAE